MWLIAYEMCVGPGHQSPTVSVRVVGVSAPDGGAVVLRSGTTGAFASIATLTVPVNDHPVLCSRQVRAA